MELARSDTSFEEVGVIIDFGADSEEEADFIVVEVCAKYDVFESVNG